MECARQLLEAEDLGAGEAEGAVQQLYRALSSEFALELQRVEGASPNRGVQLESAYTRFTGISGQPLIDGYHFSQTLTNDFGRPYGEGANWYAGGADSCGRRSFRVLRSSRVSKFLAQSAVPLSAAQNAIAQADFTPTAAAGPVTGYAKGRLLDAYASVDFKNNQLSFGTQSLWWGPTYGGPLLFSDNALPIPMLRYDRVKPFKLPRFLGVLGPITDAVLYRSIVRSAVCENFDCHRQSGRSLNPQPYIHGGKISFKPTAELRIQRVKDCNLRWTGLSP